MHRLDLDYNTLSFYEEPMTRSTIRRTLALILTATFAVPPVGAAAPATAGTLKGIITVEGRPLSGARLALVDLESGSVHRVTSGSDGRFQTTLNPGHYVISTEGQGGLVVSEAPTQVPVVAGETAEARVDLAAVHVAQNASDAPSAPAAAAPAGEKPVTGATLTTTVAGTTVSHDPVTCFIAGEFPLLDASIAPIPNVARARIYFRSALISTYYYVEMTPAEGKFSAKLPRPRIEASPITYYIEATTTDFTELKLDEVSAQVIAKREDCPDDKVAAIGPPGEVTVFSAATGLTIAPAGFAAGAGLIGLGGLALLLGGAAAAGIVTQVAVFNNTAAPTPTLPPAGTPTAPPVGAPPPLTP
jgi:hypothetical protein